MTEASYTAWDDKQYVWPPPEGWYQASDNKWWPEGYGPPPSDVATAAGAGAAVEDNGSGTLADEISQIDGADRGPAAGGSATDQTSQVDGADRGLAAGGSATDQTSQVDGSLGGDAWRQIDDSATDQTSQVDGSLGGDAWRQIDDSATGDVSEAAGPASGETWQADGVGQDTTARFDEPDHDHGDVWSEVATDADEPEPDHDHGDVWSEVATDADVTDHPDAASIAGAADTAASAGAADASPEEITPSDGPARSILESDADGAVQRGIETAPGSGAFADAPMEMNDLSSFSERAGFEPAADRRGGFGDFATSDGLPAIDDVLPAEDVGADAQRRPEFDDSAFTEAETPTLADLPIPGAEGRATGVPGVDGPGGVDGRSSAFDNDLDPAQVAGAAAAAAAAAADDLGEDVTQVVPTDLSAGPTDFAPPPSVDDVFAAPSGDAGPSPFDSPSSFSGQAPPAVDPFAYPPDGAPGAGAGPFASPETAPPGGFAAPTVGFGGPPAGAESQLYGGATGPEIGLDSQELLGSKPKGGSRTMLLVAIGVLALVAICAALFLALRGDDTAAVENEAATGGPGSVDQPHSRTTGVVVFYPDGDTDQRWVIEVLEPVRDATAELTSVQPAAGQVFAATRVRVRNESGIDGASVGDLEFNTVTAAGQVIERNASPCPQLADELDDTASVALGTGVEGGLCWEIPAGELDGLLLGIESAKVAGRVHIALQ